MTLPLLAIRRDAAQATLDRFKDKPFEFGRYDCARLLAFHLRQLGIRTTMAKAGRYSSPLGAKRALKRLGVETMAQLADSYGFERISPAAAVLGDLVELPSETDLGGLFIVLGNGRVLGYHENAVGAAVLQPIKMLTAWRVHFDARPVKGRP